jgi:hypothetical protein
LNLAKLCGLLQRYNWGCLTLFKVYRITGRSSPDPVAPWLGPATCWRSRHARTPWALRPLQAQVCGYEGRMQILHPDRAASPSSDVWLSVLVQHNGDNGRNIDAQTPLRAVAAKRVAAPPSHTSAEEECKPASASWFARMCCTGNATPPPARLTAWGSDLEPPCGGSSHGARVPRNYSAGNSVACMHRPHCSPRQSVVQGS